MIIGSLEIKSDVLVQVAAVKQLNDDAVFKGPPEGAVSAELSYTMGNESAFMAPKGIGVEVSVVDAEDSKRKATLYLDIPAVGKHKYEERNVSGFKVSLDGDDSNNYTANLTKT